MAESVSNKIQIQDDFVLEERGDFHVLRVAPDTTRCIGSLGRCNFLGVR